MIVRVLFCSYLKFSRGNASNQPNYSRKVYSTYCIRLFKAHIYRNLEKLSIAYFIFPFPPSNLYGTLTLHNYDVHAWPILFSVDFQVQAHHKLRSHWNHITMRNTISITFAIANIDRRLGLWSNIGQWPYQKSDSIALVIFRTIP